MKSELTGRKVAMIFVGAFLVIFAANMTMMTAALKSFPGLEVKNSYVASQTFEVERDAQMALGWDVSASVEGGVFEVAISGAVYPPDEITVVLGRATHERDDQVFVIDGRAGVYTRPVELSDGMWQARIRAVAADGTIFRQRLEVWNG